MSACGLLIGAFISLFLTVDPNETRAPDTRHPKGHLTGPIDTYRIEYTSSGLPRSRIDVDLLVQVFVLLS